MEILKPYRQRINDLDDQIVDLLVARTEVIREVAHLKFKEEIPAILQDRVDEVRERNAARAESKGLDPELVRELYARLIDYSCNLEIEMMEEMSPDIESKIVGK